ncbi:hyaluronan mediated motility receptor-like isoform X5 [Schistocerca gregaria]|uniref:hyaluronan mediated motility receptor-like isoform X5 n=1 Tax=Schistocerca gregaria TaxID=7010 RepID=UPI00211EF9C7|nr:hyaluronan mediated motility receptor-like isoform X5 [Schistocerca gregaria]
MSFSKAPVKRFNDKEGSDAPTSRNVYQHTSRTKLPTERVAISSSHDEQMNHQQFIAICLPKQETKRTQRALSTSSRASSARSQPTKKSHTTGASNRKNSKLQQRLQKEKYIKMKKELKAKEAGLLELFDTMVKLREELINDGIKDMEIIEQLKLLDAGCLGEGGDLNSVFSKCFSVTRVESKCLSSLEAKLNIDQEKLKVLDSDILKAIENLKKESRSLSFSLDKIRKSHAETMKEVLANICTLIQERDSLKESSTENYKEQLTKLEDEKNAIIDRLKKEILKAKNAQAETENALHVACLKVKEMESKVSSQEIRIKSFCSKMMKFENLLRARNRVHSLRLNNVIGTSRMLKEENVILQQHRDNLNQRCEELKGIVKRKEKENLDALYRQNSKIDQLNAALNAQRNEKQKLQRELNAATELKNEMEQKLQAMTEAANELALNPPSDAGDSKPTQHEQELQEELRSTRELLESTQQALEVLQQQNADTEQALKDAKKNTNGSDDKMELELKESRNVISSLNKTLKNVSTESEKKSKTINELKRKLQDMEQMFLKPTDYSKVHGTDVKYKMMQMEAMISQLREHNSDLQKEKLELQSELDNKERKEGEQTKIIEARDDVIRKLKIKEKKQAEKISDLSFIIQEHESAISTVHQDISASSESQDLKKLLEVRQLQVLRLEKLVQKQEEQLNKWSLQRTRHEARIAELEKALRERQRITKFPFSCASSTPVK